jgi:thiamine biosynthesis lipoprotein
LIAERFIETWGTIVIVYLESLTLSSEQLESAIDQIQEFFLEVNQKFSTYIDTSEVSQLRTRSLAIENASPLAQEVWQGCLYCRELTQGAFDPWAVEGGFDPSGFVKGWAAERAAEIAAQLGVESILINAAGDLFLRGGRFVENGDLQPWVITIADPMDDQAIVNYVEVSDGAVATSGISYRGAHIVDPHTKLIAIGAQSASVVGPSGGITDALATALMVDGRDAQKWMGRPELMPYSYWVANRDGESAWSYGTAFKQKHG